MRKLAKVDAEGMNSAWEMRLGIKRSNDPRLTFIHCLASHLDKQ